MSSIVQSIPRPIILGNVTKLFRSIVKFVGTFFFIRCSVDFVAI